MKKLQVLLVEDNPADAALVLHELTSAGFTPEWSRVQTEADFLAALEKMPDIILSDYSMPQFTGLRALELLRASGLDIPLNLISGTVGEDVAVEAMRLGAVDYLLKDRTVRLPSAVKRALKEKQLRDERNQAAGKSKAQMVELQRWQEATLNREDRVRALKNEVNELLQQAGKPPRYSAV